MHALEQSYGRTKARNYAELPEGDGAAHQLLEQHRVRGCRRQHRLLPRQFHPAPRSALRLDPSGRRQRSRPPSGRACTRSRRPSRCSIRRAATSRTPTTGRAPASAPAARTARTIRPTCGRCRRTRAASTPSACCTMRSDLTLDGLIAAGLRQLPDRLRAAGAGRCCRTGTRCRPATPLKARLARAGGALRGWDLRWALDSVPTSLAVYWGQDMVKEAAAARTRRGDAGGRLHPDAT